MSFLSIFSFFFGLVLFFFFCSYCFTIIILHYSKDTYTSINANMRYAPNTDTIRSQA